MSKITYNDDIQLLFLPVAIPWLLFGFFYFEIRDAGYLMSAILLTTCVSIVLILATAWCLFRRRSA